MKKVLENELISLAHRILKLKNRADIHQLKKETGILYEKLSVLSFAEKHFGGLKPTIGKKEFTDAYYKTYENFDEEGDYMHPDGTEYNEDAISEPNTEKIKDIVSQMPPEAEQVDYLMEQFQKLKNEDFEAFQSQHISTDETTTEDSDVKADSTSNPKETIDQSAPDTDQAETDEHEQMPSNQAEEDFGVHFDDLPDFEPKTETPEKMQEDDTQPSKQNDSVPTQNKTSAETNSQPNEVSKATNEGPKRTLDLFQQDKKSLNDQLQKGIKIGLNDRLAFTKHLFDGQVEDYNRVLSQLDSFASLSEVKEFLEQSIVPEYTGFTNKPEIYERFLGHIERKFKA